MSKMIQNGCKMIQKWNQTEQIGTQMVPKSTPRRAPNGPTGLKMAQEVPRWPQEGSKRPLRTPKMAQRGAKMPPRDHTMAPRGFKMAPKGAKMAPRWTQEASQGAKLGAKMVLILEIVRFQKTFIFHVFFNKNDLLEVSKWRHFGSLRCQLHDMISIVKTCEPKWPHVGQHE